MGAEREAQVLPRVDPPDVEPARLSEELRPGQTAAAVWIPPGGTELSPAQEAQVEPLLIELLGRQGAARIISAGEAFERAHPDEAAHYYLSLLGTDPGHRGKGLGLALLRQTLTRADDDVPAYLEASNPANVVLYERYGFRRRSSFVLPGGPEVTTMWRDPLGRDEACAHRQIPQD